MEFTCEATFTSDNIGVFGPGIDIEYYNDTPGPFSTHELFISDPLDLSFINDTVNIQGFIEFVAFNQSGPSSIELGRNSGINPIPEPATVFLFGSGLCLFAGFRRKFKKK